MSVSENVRTVGIEPKLGKFARKYPLLVERAKHWGFELPSDATWADRVIVWRLPPIERSGGGIYIPGNLDSPHVLGVLVGAGMKALEELESNGITLGHYVKFERFAGWEHNDQTPEKLRGARFLYLNSRQILSSTDLKDALEEGRVNYLTGEDGRVRLERKLISSKKERVLKLARDPGATPAERKTARAIAARLK